MVVEVEERTVEEFKFFAKENKFKLYSLPRSLLTWYTESLGYGCPWLKDLVTHSFESSVQSFSPATIIVYYTLIPYSFNPYTFDGMRWIKGDDYLGRMNEFASFPKLVADDFNFEMDGGLV